MNDSLNRRRFLKSSALVAGTLTLPQIFPNIVIAAEDHTTPNHKITIGCIGVGGMGSANLSSFLGQADCLVVAVCDISGAARQKAREK